MFVVECWNHGEAPTTTEFSSLADAYAYYQCMRYPAERFDEVYLRHDDTILAADPELLVP